MSRTIRISVIGYGYGSGIWRQWCLKSVLAYRQSKDHLCNLVCCPNIEWRLMVQVKEPNTSKRTPKITISVWSSEPQKILGFLFAAALNSILRCCKEASEISQISLATLCQGNLLGWFDTMHQHSVSSGALNNSMILRITPGRTGCRRNRHEWFGTMHQILAWKKTSVGLAQDSSTHFLRDA